MNNQRLFNGAVAAGACAAVASLAGIAVSAAAPSDAPTAYSAIGGPALKIRGGDVPFPPAGMAAMKMGIGAPPVHAVETVPNKAGDGFDTVVEDAGTVKSVSANNLTITEGTDKATYGTPTLTIPTDARVVRNFEIAKLSDIQVGDHVDVRSSSDGTTFVFAADSEHWLPSKRPLLLRQGQPPNGQYPGPTTGPTGNALPTERP
jgi:hypothetical protein